MVQYCLPFSAVDLRRMAAAFRVDDVVAMEREMMDVGDDGEYYPLERVPVDNSRQFIGSWIEPPPGIVEPSDGEADPR